MDGIIVLLMIIGIISKINKNKKKKEAARKARQMENAFAEVSAMQAKPAKPIPKPAEAVKKPAPVKAARPAPVKIPFTKEEWAQFLADEPMDKAGASAEGVSAAPGPSPEGRASRRQPRPEGFSPALRSTQGESEAEHKKHVERIVEEEKRMKTAAQAQHKLRSMHRQKMREAVIMSEVLSKPVALRPRGQRL